MIVVSIHSQGTCDVYTPVFFFRVSVLWQLMFCRSQNDLLSDESVSISLFIQYTVLLMGIVDSTASGI